MSHYVDIRRADGSKPATQAEAKAILERNPPRPCGRPPEVIFTHVSLGIDGRSTLAYISPAKD